jgi:hypothetical protein
MYLVNISRSQLLRCVAPGKVIGEIGTAEGAFAADILIYANPEKLHLIDPWEHQDQADYVADTNNVDQDAFDLRYKDVQKKFSAPISSGVVEVHRAYSPAAADLFPDHYFDYVYIDGMHTESAVYDDLKAFDPKVKPDGLILGHDYVSHQAFRDMGFGVVEAVNRFVQETGYEFTALTYEGSPTYAISKNPESANRMRLVSNILTGIQPPAVIVDIKNAENKVMSQTDVVLPDGTRLQTLIGFD